MKNGYFERREHKRFQVRGKTFAFLYPDYHILGPIADISLGGFSFCYMEGLMVNEIDMDALSDNGFNIGLSLIMHQFHLDDVPVAITSNILVPQGNGQKDFVKLRRCGVQFKYLTRLQEIKLNTFIQGLDG